MPEWQAEQRNHSVRSKVGLDSPLFITTILKRRGGIVIASPKRISAERSALALKTVATFGSCMAETGSGESQISRALRISNPGMENWPLATGHKNEFRPKDIDGADCYSCGWAPIAIHAIRLFLGCSLRILTNVLLIR